MSAKEEEEKGARVWQDRRRVVDGWVGELEKKSVLSGRKEDMGR